MIKKFTHTILVLRERFTTEKIIKKAYLTKTIDDEVEMKKVMDIVYGDFTVGRAYTKSILDWDTSKQKQEVYIDEKTFYCNNKTEKETIEAYNDRIKKMEQIGFIVDEII